ASPCGTIAPEPASRERDLIRSPETWPRGRRHSPAKGACGQKLHRGFESLRLCQIPPEAPLLRSNRLRETASWRVEIRRRVAPAESFGNLVETVERGAGERNARSSGRVSRPLKPEQRVRHHRPAWRGRVTDLVDRPQSYVARFIDIR